MLGSGKRKGRVVRTVLWISLCCMSTLCWAQNPDLTRLPPVDEADRDLSLLEFREALLLAVQNREPESLVDFIDPRVDNGTRTPAGIQAFVKKWRPEAIDSEIWSVLEPILTMGGGFLRSEKGVRFCAPYVFTHFPDKFDIFGYGLVVEDGIPMMSAPSSGSQKLAELSYHVVRVIDWRSVPDAAGTPGQFWIKVGTLDSREGYIRKESIRSPSDYSACFLQNRQGVWKMISLSSPNE